MAYIAILFTDIPQYPPGSAPAEQFGDYADQTMTLLKSQGTTYNLKKFKTQELQELPDLHDKDLKGVILTGSRSDSFHNGSPWLIKLESFLVELLQKNQIPVIGFCFGHQLICKLVNKLYSDSFEDTVGRNPQGWEFGIKPINLSSSFKKFFEELTGISINDKLNLVECHQDVVYSVPKQVGIIGSTDICKIQGIYNDKILTFQGHPEFTSAFQNNFLLPKQVKVDRLSSDEFEKILKSGLSNQGELIGKLVVKFIEIE